MQMMQMMMMMVEEEEEEEEEVEVPLQLLEQHINVVEMKLVVQGV